MEIVQAVPELDAHSFGVLQTEREQDQQVIELHPSSDEYWKAILSRHAVNLVAKNDVGVVLGTSGAKLQKDGVSAVMRGLYVLKQERQKGIGKKLVEAMIELLRSKGITKIFTEIDATNLRSLHLHEQLGFKIIDTVEDKKGNTYMKLEYSIT